MPSKRQYINIITVYINDEEFSVINITNLILEKNVSQLLSIYAKGKVASKKKLKFT